MKRRHGSRSDSIVPGRINGPSFRSHMSEILERAPHMSGPATAPRSNQELLDSLCQALAAKNPEITQRFSAMLRGLLGNMPADEQEEKVRRVVEILGNPSHRSHTEQKTMLLGDHFATWLNQCFHKKINGQSLEDMLFTRPKTLPPPLPVRTTDPVSEKEDVLAHRLERFLQDWAGIYPILVAVLEHVVEKADLLESPGGTAAPPIAPEIRAALHELSQSIRLPTRPALSAVGASDLSIIHRELQAAPQAPIEDLGVAKTVGAHEAESHDASVPIPPRHYIQTDLKNKIGELATAINRHIAETQELDACKVQLSIDDGRLFGMIHKFLAIYRPNSEDPDFEKLSIDDKVRRVDELIASLKQPETEDALGVALILEALSLYDTPEHKSAAVTAARLILENATSTDAMDKKPMRKYAAQLKQALKGLTNVRLWDKVYADRSAQSTFNEALKTLEGLGS